MDILVNAMVVIRGANVKPVMSFNWIAANTLAAGYTFQVKVDDVNMTLRRYLFQDSWRDNMNTCKSTNLKIYKIYNNK